MFATPMAWERHHGGSDAEYIANNAYQKERGSWTHYGQNIPFMQDRKARSVDLAVGIEFEIFEGRTDFNALPYDELMQAIADDIYTADPGWEFRGQESYTIRSAVGQACDSGQRVSRTCYNFPARYWD